MKDFVIRHKLLSGFLLLTTLVCISLVWDATAFTRGRMVARFDLAHGRYRILGYGLPSAWRNEYAQLLQQRYGIRFEAVADCLVSEPLVAYVDAYDSVSVAAAKGKFGPDILTNTWEDAERSWVHKPHKQEERNPLEWISLTRVKKRKMWRVSGSFLPVRPCKRLLSNAVGPMRKRVAQNTILYTTCKMDPP